MNNEKISTNLLTVAFPLYERYEFFEKALQSVLNQTIVPKIIAVDNASSHSKFREICEKYDVKYYRNDSNIGLFPNWNRCMSLIETEYGMIFQDENIMHPTFVEKFLSILKLHENLDAYYTNFEIVDLSTQKTYNHKHCFPFGYMEQGIKVVEDGVRFGFGLPYCIILKPKNFKGYITDCHGSNDWVYSYSEVDQLSVYGNREILYQYGKHVGQDSKNPETYTRMMLSLSYLLDEVLSVNTRLSGETRDLATERAKEYFWLFLRSFSNNDVKDLNSDKHLYGRYLQNKISRNGVFMIVFHLPKELRSFLYSILRKIGFLKGISVYNK